VRRTAADAGLGVPGSPPTKPRVAKALIECWNEQLAAGRDMLWSPTIRAALLAGRPIQHCYKSQLKREPTAASLVP
jgi:hypothetical protein